ncbi:MAG: hypothetical protein WCF57_05280 [Pyrinomonadaceae bacterium]
MAKSSEKVAANRQPESQRGKSRFGVQPRSGRVVLPDRPPREVDNEIVSILLGGDPASLAAQVSEEPISTVAEAAPLNLNVEVAPSAQDLRRDERPEVSEAAADSRPLERPSSSSSVSLQTSVTGSPTTTSPALEAAIERTPTEVGRASSAPTRGISARTSSLPRPEVGRSSLTIAESPSAQDLAISSFEEFADRWRHGLRKGQLKVCEVLYQKTYALGETECVTSFSELGRLSGLKMRQCFNIIAQLEALKFVERAKSEATSNKKDQGSVIRFYLFPKN